MGSLAIKGGRPVRTRPFQAWPIWDERDQERLIAVLRSRVWGEDGSNEGTMTREFERAFAAYHGALDGVCVTNGTAGLTLSLRALGIRPGDEVIMPAITCVATAASIFDANGIPVLVDVDPKTFCIDPNAVESAITRRTRAIIAVHMYCCMADMDALVAIARKHGLALIEDCAQAQGGQWQGHGAGTLGDVGVFSFQTSKTMSAGEGGIVISRREDVLNKVFSQRNCGRSTPQRGHRIAGGNDRMTEWQAAILCGQLERLDQQIASREQAILKLRVLTASLRGIRIVEDQPQVTRRPGYRLPFHYDREAASGIPLSKFIMAMRAEGIPVEASFPSLPRTALYAPDTMTWYPFPTRYGYFPVSDAATFDTAFTLPHELLLGSDDDLADIASAMAKVLEHAEEAADIESRVKDHAKRTINWVTGRAPWGTGVQLRKAINFAKTHVGPKLM